MSSISHALLIYMIAQSHASAPVASQPTPPTSSPKAAWLSKADGPWNNDLGVLFLADAKPAQSGSSNAIPHASAPTLASLGGDRLLGVFEYFSREDRRDFGVLASSESKDGGKTWSRPRRLELTGLAADDGRPRFPALLALPDGQFRLYVTLYPKNSRSVIASFASKDGRTFTADPGRRLALPDAGLVSPIAVASGGSVHLFAHRAARTRELIHAISKDGLHFDRLPDLRTDSPLALPPAVRDAAIVATPRGLLVIGTADGANWSIASATGIPPTTDIASARLKPGETVALIVSDRRRGPDGNALVMGKRPSAAKTHASGKPAPDNPAQPADMNADPNNPGEAQATDDWPPEPDFLSPIDYVAWVRERAAQNAADNAAPVYRQFMLKQDTDGRWVSALPPMSSMMNDPTYSGDHGPWRPEDHPDWERSIQSALPFIQQYKSASSHADYATSVDIDPDAKGPALVNFLLPDLSVHRTICKEILASSWRAPDGKVDPDAMVDAWKTTLTSAKHIGSGVTLIEDLVGVSIASVTYADARDALSQGVIPPERLSDALETLRKNAPRPRDPADLLVGEAAFAADLVQYVTDTNTTDGAPRLNAERVQEMAGFLSEKPMPPEDLDEMLKKDPREIGSALRDYYRETADAMRIGYPDVNAKKMNELTDRYVREHPEIGPILPALGRVETLMTRNEASRRATELAYEVNIFKARQGRWPASLDELPAAPNTDSHVDPFTKQNFLYRVGPNGPIIYSASENGKDDGGQHSPRWGDGNQKADESDDFIFWPPQPRPKPKTSP